MIAGHSDFSVSTAAVSFAAATKRYGSVTAVDNLDLTLQPGELFGFLGPNGAGKTTAMKMAAGLVKPTSGTVLIAGYDIQDHPLEAKRLFGFVPDSPYIYESLTGREYLHFSAGLYKLDHSYTKRRVAELTDMFGIGDMIDKRAGEYSHGMKQRLVTASAFLHDPKIIIIDEPMVGLDPNAVRKLKVILKDYCRNGGTVFFSTHTLSDAEELCDRIGIIHRGRLITCGRLVEMNEVYGSLEDMFIAATSQSGVL